MTTKGPTTTSTGAGATASGGASKAGGGGGVPATTGGQLRDYLSSVAHYWVDAHLHSSPSSASQARGRRASGQRRPSRIRSWIGYGEGSRGKEGENENDGDNSLRFTDTSDDDFADEVGRAQGARRRSASHGSRRGRSHAPTDPVSRSRSHRPNQDPAHTHVQTHGPIHVRDPTASQRRNENGSGRVDHPDATEEKTGRMHMLPDEIREEDAVDTLTGLMGDGFDREVARRILRKYDGNVEKAAAALLDLEGERGEDFLDGPGPAGQAHNQGQSQGQDQGWLGLGGAGGSGSSSTWPLAGMTQTSSQARLDAPPSTLSGRPNTPVIDLTLDDDPDLQRAMQESMNTLQSGPQSAYAPSYTSSQSLSQQYAPSQGQVGQAQTSSFGQIQPQPEGPVFGPSERQPDPNWAIVPSQQNENTDESFFHNLNRAIEASLETMGDSEALEPFPVEQQLRRDGCPVVLRPSMHTMVYAASIIQGLFYVPQVRERMACWRPPVFGDGDEAAPPMNGPDYTMWALSEIFTHMDLARLCDLNVDKRLPAFNIEPWDQRKYPLGELSRRFYARLAATLEKAFVDQFAHAGQPLPKPRLLHFQYGSGMSEPGELLQETPVVPIDVNGGESNDLIGRLSAQLSRPQPEPGKQNVIFEPSEVVAFELVRSATSSEGGLSERKLFTYPKSIYLDQFLRENIELAQAKRRQKQEMFEDVQRLVLHKKTLTNFNNKDTLKDLKSTIFYFENVADAEGNPERSASLQATAQKLKGILSTVEEGVQATDHGIDALRAQAETLLECEELQQYKYDLRVVFVHDGVCGRKHLYSYVQDKSCWWKIADSLITKVPEEVVLNDQAGLHLGAGPYLLFYSRAVPENEGPPAVLPWMDDIKDDVNAANREFLSQLPPELVGDIILDEEDELFASVIASEPGLTRKGERMDVS